jgi:HAE1 family hydrophobic/amphiphilic exporter-1
MSPPPLPALSRQPPQDMPSPPSYQKVNPADEPILFIALTTPTLPLSELNEYAETMMAQRMSMISGVAQVMVYGSQKYAVRVQLDPVALSSRAIGINEVAQAIQSGNVTLPTGILYGSHRSFTIQATGQLNTAEEYRPLIVTYRNGAPVRLGDIATVTDSVENNKVAAWYINEKGTQRAIILAVQRQPGTNTVEVGRQRLLPPSRTSYPPGLIDIM